MNPIIYAANSKEFKRAFGRILRCQFRRRPRSFVETQLSRSVATEMRKLTRFATLGKKDATNQQNPVAEKRTNGGMGSLSMLLQSVSLPSGDNHTKRRLAAAAAACSAHDRQQSPIASLRLLQSKRNSSAATSNHGPSTNNSVGFLHPAVSPTLTSPTSSDDDVTYTQHLDDEDDVMTTDDERSEHAQQMSPLMPSQTSLRGRVDKHQRIPKRNADGYAIVPHIVIDSCEEKRGTTSTPKRRAQGTPIQNHHTPDYNTDSKQDNIMWL